MFSGYPTEDWAGVFVLWYASHVGIGYLSSRVILALLDILGRYTNRIAEGLVPAEPAPEVSLLAKTIAVVFASLLLLTVLGGSLAVTSVIAPRVGLSDLGQPFAYVSGFVLGVGFGGIVSFFVGAVIILERVKRRKQNSGKPPASRLRISDNTIQALNRLKDHRWASGVVAGPLGS